MVNSVKFTGVEKPINTNDKKTLKQENNREAAAEQEAYIVDIGNKSEKKATYEKPGVAKPDAKKIEQLKREAEEAFRPLRQMVEALLKKQGMSFKYANLLSHEGKVIEIDADTRAEAQRLISDDGEYGIEKTSDRLVEFAKAVSGNDKTKFNELKSAIEKGFKAAEKAFGGELPEICKKTIDRTMEKLNQWAESVEE